MLGFTEREGQGGEGRGGEGSGVTWWMLVAGEGPDENLATGGGVRRQERRAESTGVGMRKVT